MQPVRQALLNWAERRSNRMHCAAVCGRSITALFQGKILTFRSGKLYSLTRVAWRMFPRSTCVRDSGREALSQALSKHSAGRAPDKIITSHPEADLFFRMALIFHGLDDHDSR